jgi:hypothetical protein
MAEAGVMAPRVWRRVLCAGCDEVFRFWSFARLAERVRAHVRQAHGVTS